MTSKLLVALDGSESAQRAVAYAIKLAKDHRASSLHLISVMPPKKNVSELERQQVKNLFDPAVEMAKTAGVAHTVEIVSGGLASQIVKRADELNCDGIVMGTHGMSAIGNLLMGSVATEVVRQTKLPVTLVK